MNRPALLMLICLAGLLPAADTAAAADEQPLTPVRLQRVALDGFWQVHAKRLTERWIPHCIRQMEAGGAGQELLNLVYTANALNGETHGKFTGCPWSDAYVYNTMEAACLALAVDPQDDEQLAEAQAFLRTTMEQWIPIILAAQSDDGYIHSYHVVNKFPQYSNIRSHEFYVQGYFIEMGVAHYRLTGGADRRLFDAAVRCADRLCATFGPPPKRVWMHGHAGMGYALCRLARLVDEIDGPGAGDKYHQLAKFLLDTRHTVVEHRSPYHQSHRPVVEMTDAVGHAVRATYFYTAVTDLAMLAGDDGYRAAANRIWSNAVHRKHYITGGVGASHRGEAFADDFDLRNDGYCESCAGCGMTFWADRMNRMRHDAHHIDVQERTLYNNVLGAVELTGENFFYQNPLASERARYPWHGCPCCVGNIPRTLLGIKDLIYALDGQRRTLYLNHFVASDATVPDVAGTSIRLVQQTGYPVSGDVKLTLTPQTLAEFTLAIRIPDRTESELYTVTPPDDDVTVKLNGAVQSLPVERGYVRLSRRWQAGDVVELGLPLDVQRVHCDERVRANRGRVTLIRGPIVYNVENVDHECDVRDLILPPDAPLTAVWRADLLGGVMTIEGQALRPTDQGPRPTPLVAVPNFVRLNRGGFSQVWITEDPTKIEPDVGPPPPPQVKPIIREELDKRTIDRVVVGDAKSEQQHKLQGQNTSAGVFRNFRWRHAGNGWFSYELKVAADAAIEQAVLCTYWGSDVGNRRFDILVDGQKIAEQTLDRNKPDEFFDIEYPIPADLIANKTKITVRLQSHPPATAGGVFDLRVVRVKE